MSCMFARTGFKTDGDCPDFAQSAEQGTAALSRGRDCPPLRIGFETASTPTFIDVSDLCASLNPVQTPECSALDPQVRSAANFLRAFAATTLCLARRIVAHAAPATATAFSSLPKPIWLNRRVERDYNSDVLLVRFGYGQPHERRHANPDGH
jgi:hypothetical protein